MAYSEAKVLIGGLAHIPILIGIFWVIDRRIGRKFLNEKLAKEAKAKSEADAKLKAKAMAEAQTKPPGSNDSKKNVLKNLKIVSKKIGAKKK